MNVAEDFLLHLLGSCWDKLCDHGRSYLNNKPRIRESLLDSARSYKPRFNEDFSHVVGPIVDRFIAEVEPVLTKRRFLLHTEKSEVLGEVVTEIYQANREYWDGAFETTDE